MNCACLSFIVLTLDAGVFQDHDGSHSCNDGGIQDPCPQSEIAGMVQDGMAGTAAGDGLQQVVAQGGGTGSSQGYYKGARIYNSGSIVSSGDLGRGIATHCYASDIANRLTGWVTASHGCNLG